MKCHNEVKGGQIIKQDIKKDVVVPFTKKIFNFMFLNKKTIKFVISKIANELFSKRRQNKLFNLIYNKL